jgi:hypothetical protein
MERGRAHACGLGKVFDPQRARIIGSDDRHRPGHAMGGALGYSQVADRRTVAAGHEPEVHLAHQLRFQNGNSRGPIEQAHQAQRGIGDFVFGWLHPNRSTDRFACDIHLKRERFDDRRVQLEHQRVVRCADVGLGDLAHRGHIGSDEQRVAGSEIKRAISHHHALAALYDKRDQRT